MDTITFILTKVEKRPAKLYISINIYILVVELA